MAETKSKETSIAIKDLKLTPANVKDNYKRLVEMVGAKRETLNGVAEGEMKTSGICNWRHDNQGASVNIHETKNISLLIAIIGHVAIAKRAYIEGTKLLGAEKSPSFRWCGYTLEDWVHDARLRISVLKYEERKSTLDKAEEVLSNYMSEEEKMAADLSKIVEAINF